MLDSNQRSHRTPDSDIQLAATAIHHINFLILAPFVNYGLSLWDYIAYSEQRELCVPFIRPGTIRDPEPWIK